MMLEWLVGTLLLAMVLYPAGVLIQGIFDPALNGRGLPALARRLHETLSPRYARWARERRASREAGQLGPGDVSGTEWPLYGSVFYLRAEEAVQAAWERDHTLFAQEPRVYAREAIEAAARLVADPAPAAWVQRYWGEAYLDREDVFYRMLLISALASHRRLTGSEEFVPLLARQTDGLARELAAAPTGWLDDYPGQCFPTDIVSAWEAIQRADRVLGMDHAAQIAEGWKGFSGERVGPLGLPPYYAYARAGRVADGSRGCANSNLCTLGPGLWPGASGWYAAYEKSFWQQDSLAAGFREFPKGAGSPDWYFDVDAGPVVRGNGFAACAFGVGAARANGRFDHAYPLSLEMIALSWPLPGGRLLVPRIVSDAANAPLLGEAGVFLVLTQEPVKASPGAEGEKHHTGGVPGVVWIVLAAQLGVAVVLLWRMFRILRPKREKPGPGR